jgi:predicted amidohydrolase
LLAATGAGALLGLAALGGWAALEGRARAEPASPQVVRIALVQPGDIADPAERLAAHAALTAAVGRTGGADLVVWGQSSVTGDPAQQPAVEGVLRRAAADAGVDDVLVNGKAGNPAAPSNTSWLYTPDGARATYHKRLLVPFGEYLPWRRVLGWLEGLTPAPDLDRVPGSRPVVMRTAGVTIGPLISYESAFPGLRRELARLGADLTVVQGSLGTFQGSWLHAQQAAMEAVRAMETGRPAVLGAMSGTSAAFDARGRLLLWQPHQVTGVFVVTVPLVRVDTPYARWATGHCGWPPQSRPARRARPSSAEPSITGTAHHGGHRGLHADGPADPATAEVRVGARARRTRTDARGQAQPARRAAPRRRARWRSRCQLVERAGVGEEQLERALELDTAGGPGAGRASGAAPRDLGRSLRWIWLRVLCIFTSAAAVRLPGPVARRRLRLRLRLEADSSR